MRDPAFLSPYYSTQGLSDKRLALFFRADDAQSIVMPFSGRFIPAPVSADMI